MAKANLTLPDGTTVNIEGTADEVAILLAKFSGGDSETGGTRKRKTKRKKVSKKKTRSGTRAKRKGPQVLIGELADADYFKKKRGMSDIQKKLEQQGHIYAMTSLSTPLLRLTRNGTLRRLKEDGNWVYVS